MDFDSTAGTNEQTPFTFHGEFERAVDKKGRFNLPFRFRQGGSGSADEKYVVSGGADGSLILRPYSGYIAKMNGMSGEKMGAERRRNVRMLSRSSLTLEPDSQGRVAVNPALLAKVGITNKVTVVGMVSYMELWDPATLEQMDADGEGPDAGFMDEFLR